MQRSDEKISRSWTFRIETLPVGADCANAGTGINGITDPTVVQAQNQVIGSPEVVARLMARRNRSGPLAVLTPASGRCSR